MKIINNNPLSGCVAIPPSKSLVQRALICAALADGTSEISGLSMSQDVSATLNALESLGAIVSYKGDSIKITGPLKTADFCSIDVESSASTLKLLIPIATVFCKRVVFKGAKHHFGETLNPILLLFDEIGINYALSENSFNISGTLSPGKYCLKGDVSSYYISGLIFALSALDSVSWLNIKAPLVSKSYVDLTLQTMKHFGATVKNNDYKSFSFDKSKYIPSDYIMDGDVSMAASFLASAALGNNVTCANLSAQSLCGDAQILNILESCGCKVVFGKHTISVFPDELHGICVDSSKIIGLVAIVAVLLCFCSGESKITNLDKFRLNDGTGYAALASELEKMGAKIKAGDDCLFIKGVKRLKGASVSAHNDSKLAMALAIAATRMDGALEMEKIDYSDKNFAGFIKNYKALGGMLS